MKIASRQVFRPTFVGLFFICLNFNKGYKDCVNSQYLTFLLCFNYGIIMLLSGGRNMVAKRSIVSCILLSIFTCGLYWIFGWLPGIANDLNTLDRSQEGPTGVTVVLLSIVTCGIYAIYFTYVASKRIFNLFQVNDLRASDNTVINVVLYIFQLSIVSYAIMQNDINNYIDATSNTYTV